MSKSYDAHPQEGVVGELTFEDLAIWGDGPSEFIRSEAGISEPPFVWVGKRPLGKGAFGVAGLWEKIDPEGNVVDVRAFPLLGDNRS